MDHPHLNHQPQPNADTYDEFAGMQSALQAWAAFGHSLPHELGSSLHLIVVYSTVLLDSEAASLSPRGRKHLDASGAPPRTCEAWARPCW